jgi:hypothetical protein
MLETSVTVMTSPAIAASMRLMLLAILLSTIKRMETKLIGGDALSGGLPR